MLAQPRVSRLRAAAFDMERWGRVGRTLDPGFFFALFVRRPPKIGMRSLISAKKKSPTARQYLSMFAAQVLVCFPKR